MNNTFSTLNPQIVNQFAAFIPVNFAWIVKTFVLYYGISIVKTFICFKICLNTF